MTRSHHGIADRFMGGDTPHFLEQDILTMLHQHVLHRTQITGFNLLEMMIVISIISLITALGFPLYKQHTQHSDTQQAKTTLWHFTSLLEQHHAQTGHYTGAQFPALTNTRYTLHAHIKHNSFELCLQPQNADQTALSMSSLTMRIDQSKICSKKG